MHTFLITEVCHPRFFFIRIFLKNSEVCKNVLEWIQSTQRHKQAEDICNDSEAGVDSEVGVDSAQTLH